MGKGLYKKIVYIWGCFLDIIFPMPSTCSVCGRVLKEFSRKYICSGCLSQIKTYDNQLDIRNVFGYTGEEEGTFEEYIDEVECICKYEGIAREMIHRLKYNDKRNIALTISAMMEERLTGREFDIIISVPVSKDRLKKRGYNQSEIIARELSDIMGIPYIDGMQRIKDTMPQVLLSGTDRWYNVEGAFECKLKLEDKSILLIDDVITTGATIYYCARELKNSGAKSVTALSFAKSIL